VNFDWSTIIKPTGIPVSSERLELFEGQLGCRLPQDYRAFILDYNGGKVTVDQGIQVPQLSCEVFVRNLLPLSKASPSLGVIEARDIQSRHRLCLRQALEIADDGGTGFFYLILQRPKRGAVYFVYKDDRPMLEGDWYSSTVRIPECMAHVSPSFDALGEAVLGSREW
jgi:hypothetical protein